MNLQGTGFLLKDWPGFHQITAILITSLSTNLPSNQQQLARIKNSFSTSNTRFVRLISLSPGTDGTGCSSSCDYLQRHLSHYLLSCVLQPKMCRVMGQNVNSPDGCRRNWSKLTVYPGIRQLQPPTEIKGNIWIVHLDLNNREEMSKHIPTHTNGTIWQSFYLGPVQKVLFRVYGKYSSI